MPAGRFDRGGWKRVKNGHGSIAPAGGFAIPDSPSFDATRDCIIITRPTADDMANVLIISEDIPIGGYGIAYESGTVALLWNGAAPVVGDRLGSQTDSWHGAVSDQGTHLIRAVTGTIAFGYRHGSSIGNAAMLIADEAMVADDTEYDAKILEADGTEGATVKVRRPNGVYVAEDNVGFLGRDSSDQNIFIDAHSWPKAPSATDTVGVLTEGTEAAAADTFDFTASANGLTLNIMTRVAYYDAGNETLYGYARTLVFDEMGHLVTVSAETRVTVDVPVACP